MFFCVCHRPDPVTDAPRFHKGNIVVIVMAVVTVFVSEGVRYLDNRRRRKVVRLQDVHLAELASFEDIGRTAVGEDHTKEKE